MSGDLFSLLQDYQHGTSMNTTHNLQLAGCEEDPSCMSFTDPNMVDYNSLARAFGLSPSSSQVMDHHNHNMMTSSDPDQVLGCTRIVNPRTANSSPSSSTETGAEEDSGKVMDPNPKGSEHGGSEKSKKSDNGKKKKKGEKKAREARFAFMTKSEVDHLEDGYRWRKYGQKAVKNSLYPRSYFRCTAQKCTVKKRVERSYQDPSMVITTYEGKHSHPIPTTLRGSLYPHSRTLDLMFHTNYNINGHGGSASFNPQISAVASNLHRHQQSQHQQFHQLQDNWLWQDIYGASDVPKT